MLSEIRDLYAFNRWANARTWAMSEPLDPDAFTRDLGSSFPSVQATLVHILGAEWIWLQRWKGTSPAAAPGSWDVTTPTSLARHRSEVEAEQSAFLHGLTDTLLHEPVSYRNTRGEPLSELLHHQMRHVVNHSTYHRGQIVTLLRQLGLPAVGTDLILYHREAAGAGHT